MKLTSCINHILDFVDPNRFPRDCTDIVKVTYSLLHPKNVAVKIAYDTAAAV